MESPGETPIGRNANDMNINFESNSYKIKLYLDFTNLVIKLEPEDNDPDKVFQDSFNLFQIQNFHPFFKGFPTLEEAKKQITNILIGNANQNKIQKNQDENSVSIVINMFGNEILIPLKKYLKEKNFNYNNLSQEMKNKIDNDDIILGIDLGTTYSCASIMLDEHIIMIENSLGLRTTPSYVCFFERDKICLGELAKLQPSYEYKNIIYNTKRLLGRNIDDKEIKEIIPDLPFIVEQDKKLNQLKINLNFKNPNNNNTIIETFYPEQISALILKKIINDSEYYLRKLIKKEIKIKKAVITVPAYFNQKQREATKQAAEIINLDVKRMINEPTAASLAYGYNSLENNKKLIVVLDFGGGTLDLTLLQFLKNDLGIYCDIKFSFGDTHFGGEDFDYILMKKCLESINQNQFDKNLPCNIRLKRACEIAKIKLSTFESTNIILEEYSKNKNINYFLTKKDFEKYCKSLFDKFESILKTFIKSSGYKDDKNNEVILIGGSTLIPKIQDIVKKIFKYSKIKNDLNPKEAVAKGAAIQAAILSNLNSVKNINLLDVTNLSLGIRMKGDKMSKIIKRSTPLPEERSEIYVTTADNQTEALIEVFEGEDDITTNNLCLDKFRICNLPKMKKGEAKIMVNIFINNDSILKVTATDLQKANNFKQYEIKRPLGLRDKIDEIKKINENIKEIDLNEYNDIKDLIIDLEGEILKAKEKEQIKEINSKLINILSEFVKKIISKIDKEKIVISYIKYYFLKVMKYYENNNEDNNIIENFNKNFNSIIEEIQYINPDLIFEIIEIFVDNKILYSKCLVQILDRYYEKITYQFYKVNQLLSNEPNNFETAFNILKEIKDLIKFIERLFEIKVENDSWKNKFYSVKNSISEFNLKIEVKEFILKNRQNPVDFNRKKEKEKLENLYAQYQQCKESDLKDLIDLESMIKKSNSSISQEEKKAENFIKKFESMKDDDYQKFLFIFDKYDITEYLLTDIEIKINSPEEREKFLVFLCSKYKKYSDSLTAGGKKEAIDKINIYFNHLKKKNDEKQPLFKET